MSIKTKKTKNLLPEIVSFVYKSTLIVGVLACLFMQFLLVAQNESLNQRINQKKLG